MELSELKEMAMEVMEAYNQKNRMEGRDPWTLDNYVTGFIGDVGDLSKLIMAKSGYRDTEDLDAKIEHELTDCFWSLIVISSLLNVNLEEALSKNMNDLLNRVEYGHHAIR